MKPTLPVLVLLCLLTVTGCRTRYELSLSNSNTITAYSKPKLENGYYVFKDGNGREVRIFQGRVRQIEHK